MFALNDMSRGNMIYTMSCFKLHDALVPKTVKAKFHVKHKTHEVFRMCGMFMCCIARVYFENFPRKRAKKKLPHTSSRGKNIKDIFYIQQEW